MAAWVKNKVNASEHRLFDYTSYFVTIGLSNTVQLRLLGSYVVILELLESLLCCLARHFFLLIFPSFFSSPSRVLFFFRM